MNEAKTAVRHKNLFLFLALACFLGIIVIFIFDGYMGVYDSLEITTGEYTQNIDTEQWQQQERFGFWPTTSVDRDKSADFDYRVDNHGFSDYETNIDVSLWRNQEKLAGVIDQALTVDPFGSGNVRWSVDTADVIPEDFPPEQGYDFTVVITRGQVEERRVIIYVNPSPVPIKPPVVSRTAG